MSATIGDQYLLGDMLMVAPVVMAHKVLFFQLPERPPIGLVLRLGEVLVAEEQHLVGHPRVLELGDHLVVEVPQVDVAHFGTDAPGDR